MPKPGTGRFNGRFSEVLLGKLRALGYAETRPAAAAPVGRPAAPASRNVDEPLRLLAIGASTGGIHALASFFQALPERIGVPILVTQHLPAAFMTVFARQLAIAAGREAVVAEDGTPASRPDRGRAGRCASDGRRGPWQAGRAAAQAKVVSGCLPSVDPMLASAGAVLGAGALGVVLTGMGRDGAEGRRAAGRAGGSVIARTKASSAVWGMPRAVADAGLACAVLPPDKIARRVAGAAEARLCK